MNGQQHEPGLSRDASVVRASSRFARRHIAINDPADLIVLLALDAAYWSGDYASGLRFATLLRLTDFWNAP